jgi:hypothetical protein
MFFENEFTGSLSFARLLLALLIGLAPIALTIFVKWMLYGRLLVEDAALAARGKHKIVAIEGTLEDFAVVLANEIKNFSRPRRPLTVEA